MSQLEFFNTINLKGFQLDKAIKTVETQNDRVHQILLQTKAKLTPPQVHEIYCELYPDCPLTSIRRSLTTLTNNNRIIMLGDMVEGLYGKPNHQWVINPNEFDNPENH